MKTQHSFLKATYRSAILVLVLGSLGAQAQPNHRKIFLPNYHQLGVSVGAGAYTSLGSKPFDLSNKVKAGVNLELDYQYQFSDNRRWRVGVGVGYERSSIGFSKDKLMNQRAYVDYEEQAFLFSYRAKNYQEKWTMQQVSIPLTLEYSGKTQTAFYFRTGLKYSLQLDSQVDISYEKVETSGYFKQWDLVLTQPEFAGFGSFSTLSSSKNLKLANRWAWIGEIGIKHELRFKQQFYTAVYFDIGLNDQAKNIAKTGDDLLQYNPEPNNALLQKSFTELAKKDKAVLKTYGIGLKVRYAF